MNLRPARSLLLALACLFAAASATLGANVSIPIPADSGPTDADNLWPRVRQEVGATYTIYQPQIETWDGINLTGRAAVSVQEGKSEPIYGVVTLKTQALVDRDERMVHLDHILITGSHFPTLADANPYLDVFSALIPSEVPAISLDRIESSLEAAHSGARPKALQNDPPAIIVAYRPALLVPIDGEPYWAKVSDSPFERVLNTRALLLRDPAMAGGPDGAYFLHLYDGWLEATSIMGPWSIAHVYPAGLSDAVESLTKSEQVDLMAGQPDPDTQRLPALGTNVLPEVHVATVPTELISLHGDPNWSPVPTTQLLALTNTSAHVFKNLANQQTYVLLSGRWFKAASLAGPWTYVPGRTLPADFAAIPDASDQENVKASVPGTPQAEEAMIANDIPTTTKISRDAHLNPLPTLDGEPRLGPIEGTGIKAVLNSDVPILELHTHEWLACQNGVWFESTSVNGPWSVAAEIPPEVYSIAPSSPFYYLTFVKVYRFDPEYVWIGYTAGYYGAVASDDGTVVYGTGYHYEPYLANAVWIARPWTYGYASTLCWSPWGGWGYSFGVGFAWNAPWDYWATCPPAPFWGPYADYCYHFRYEARGGRTAWTSHGWYAGAANLYSSRGPWAGRVRTNAVDPAPTTRRTTPRYGQAYNSVTGARIIGPVHSLKAVYASPIHTEAVPVNTQVSYHASHPSPTTLARVFAGPDGRVYQREENGTWHDLAAPNHPITPASHPTTLERDYQAREQGDLRSQAFREMHPAAPAPAASRPATPEGSRRDP